MFQKKAEDYKGRLNTADKTITFAMNPPKAAAITDKNAKGYQKTDDEELFGVGNEDGSKFQNSTQVLDAASKVNQDALRSLQRSERLVASSEQTGQESLRTLQKQSESLGTIEKDLQEMQSQMNRAKKELFTFARNLAGDKCFTCIFVLVVMGLALVVGYKMYKKKKAPANPPAAIPAASPPPVGTRLITPSTEADPAAIAQSVVSYYWRRFRNE